MRPILDLLAGGLLLLCPTLSAASAQMIPFDADRWEFSARQVKVVDYLGRRALFLKDGLAIAKDADFTDGIIEYDVAVPRDRLFAGAVWRLQDPKNYEEFYIRPHQSGNPDASQYCPMYNDLAAWQLYYVENGYGAAFNVRFDEWMHVRIVVAGKKAEFYVMDMEKPIFSVSEQKGMFASGKVGLKTQGAAHFSNFNYIRMENPQLRGQTTQKPGTTSKGAISAWMVSNVFDESSLVDKVRLTQEHKQKLTWTRLGCEPSGLANLARLSGVTEGNNTVFARVTVISEKDQIKPMKFGFSDRVRVYLNDQLIYAGNDSYRSRDYRFLGTIGYYDELYLPLKKGENELWLAVSETMGGWGVQAKFEESESISYTW